MRASVRRWPTRSTPRARSSSTSSTARSCTPTRSSVTPSASSRSVETVKVFHQGAVFKNEIQLFDMIRKYTQDRPRHQRAHGRTAWRRCSWRWKTWRRRPQRNPVPAVACHNDLLSENFIIDADGKMWIIDWEYGGMTDPYFDLGDFVMEHPFTRRRRAPHHRDLLRRDGREVLRPAHALQGALRRVVGRVGDDPAHGLAHRLRLHGVGSGAHRARREGRRRPRLPEVAGAQ